MLRCAKIVLCVVFLQAFGGSPHLEVLKELFTQVRSVHDHNMCMCGVLQRPWVGYIG